MVLKCRLCFPGSLDEDKVQGKIVICDLISDGEVTQSSGAVGTIMQNPNFQDVAFLFPQPVSLISFNTGEKLFQYLRSNRYIGTSLKGWMVFKLYFSFLTLLFV